MTNTTIEEALKFQAELLNDAFDLIRKLEGQSFAYRTLCQMAMNALRQLPDVKGSVIDETLLRYEDALNREIESGNAASRQIWGAAKDVVEYVRRDPELNGSFPNFAVIDGGKPDD